MAKTEIYVANVSLPHPTTENVSMEDVLKLLGILAIAKTIMLLVVYLTAPNPSTVFHTMSTNWDGVIYQGIAENGYPKAIGAQEHAFSPFFPAIIRLFNTVIGSYWISGLVVTNVLGFIFPVLVYKLFGFRTAVLVELFPTYLVYSTLSYSDVLSLIFLALSILLFFREKYLFAGIAIALAIFNSYSLAYTIPAFIVFLIARKRVRGLPQLVKFLSPVIAIGIIILAIFQLETGNVYSYFTLERNIWGVTFVSPIVQATFLLNTNGQGWFTDQNWEVLGTVIKPVYWLVRNIVFEGFYFAGAVLLIKTKHRQKWLLFLYSMLVAVPLLFLDGTPAVSLPRLLLPAFPVFFAYSDKVFKGRVELWVYVAASIAIGTWFMLSFIYAFFS